MERYRFIGVRVQVDDFVSRVLTYALEPHREREVALFAESLPSHLTIEQQGELGRIFETGLLREQLPYSLADSFFSNLPVPSDWVSDSHVPQYNLPAYFEAALPERWSLPQRAPISGPETENSRNIEDSARLGAGLGHDARSLLLRQSQNRVHG